MILDIFFVKGATPQLTNNYKDYNLIFTNLKDFTTKCLKLESIGEQFLKYKLEVTSKNFRVHDIFTPKITARMHTAIAVYPNTPRLYIKTRSVMEALLLIKR
jgi:hypothetical protein